MGAEKLSDRAMNFEDKCKLLKLEIQARCRIVQKKKHEASDYMGKKSYLAGQHKAYQEVLASMDFIKIKRRNRVNSLPRQ